MDSKLLWEEHILEITGKAQKRLNFLRTLRTLVGFQWGANPRVLLSIYKTLIRSIFDFSAGIYDPGYQKRWAQMEKIQSDSLRMILGMRKSSPIVELQVEAGIAPLVLRLKYLLWEKLVRWMGKRNNPIISTLTALDRGFTLARMPLICRCFREVPVNAEKIEEATVAEK